MDGRLFLYIEKVLTEVKTFSGGTDEARFRLSGRRRSLRPNRRLGVPAGAGTSLRRSRLGAGQAVGLLPSRQ